VCYSIAFVSFPLTSALTSFAVVSAPVASVSKLLALAFYSAELAAFVIAAFNLSMPLVSDNFNKN